MRGADISISLGDATRDETKCVVQEHGIQKAKEKVGAPRTGYNKEGSDCSASPAPLDVSQEGQPQTLALMRALQQTRDVGQHQPLACARAIE